MSKMPTMTFWQLAASKRIRIPIIQRDYAQGRKDLRVRGVRNKFLQALHDALSGKRTLLLDFVYGEVEEDCFVPFDGQQRLTTLFLLHWYAAVWGRKLTEHTARCLKNFQYEVRDGARLFGQELVERFCPPEEPVLPPYDAEGPSALSAFIEDQNWFRPNWVHDPTIMGMLTMLDAIHAQFHDMPNLWEQLLREDAPPVSFLYEPLHNLGSSAEDVFIKMNARGKQLTDFEHFKAQLLDYLAGVMPDKVDAIALKLDNQWMDVFWFMFARDADVEDKAFVADACFSRYFAFVSGILNARPWTAKDRNAPDPHPGDLFECVRSALDSGQEQFCPKGNLHFLIASLDKLHDLFVAGTNNNGINAFFESHFTAASDKSLPVPGKIALFSNTTQLFTLCCKDSLSHAQRFMLFGCLLALTVGLEHDVAARRLRILRNVLEHSSSEFGNAYYADQIRSVCLFMTRGKVVQRHHFNTRQIEEEKAKAALRAKFPNDSNLHDALDYLEDHPLLRGRLAVFSQKDHVGEGFCFDRQTILDGKRFFELAFGVNPVSYDTIIKGLLSQGDYALRSGARLYLGSQRATDWQDIFATSSQQDFPRVRDAVQSLVAKTIDAVDTQDLEGRIHNVADAWARAQQAKGEMDWRYYFVKYPVMRPAEETLGFYHWGYSPKSFKQLQLSGSTRGSWHWSPFLWAAYVEAGFNNSQANSAVKFVEFQGREEVPLLFPCGLALRWAEFFWVIGNPEKGENLTQRQAFFVKQLQKKFRKKIRKIKAKGWLHISGVDSVSGINYNKVQDDQYRKYDREDRIQLIVPVIKALAALPPPCSPSVAVQTQQPSCSPADATQAQQNDMRDDVLLEKS